MMGIRDIWDDLCLKQENEGAWCMSGLIMCRAHEHLKEDNIIDDSDLLETSLRNV